MGIKGTKSDVTTLVVLLVLSLGGNIFLAQGWFKATRPPAPAPVLALGKVMPPLNVKELDGSNAHVGYSGDTRPTVIYLFTTTCPWCQKNLENVRSLSAQKGRDFRFIGVSLDRPSVTGLAAYVADQRLAFPIYRDPSAETRAAYHLESGVPRTIVVSSQGQVLRDWSGAYAFGNEKEVTGFFNVKLPGLVESEKAQISQPAGGEKS
jgi:peroxiredoxin